MIHKVPVTGYMGRHRKALLSVDAGKAQSTENNRVSLSPLKRKIKKQSDPQISQVVSKQKTLFKRNTIIKAIEEKSDDYENAIKEHLGISNISKDSSISNISPSKAIISHRAKQIKSMDTSQFEDLAAIELQESKITSSIKRLDRKKKVSKPKVITNAKTTEKEDKEIKLIQDSLNKINLLLNKILSKSPKRHK